MKKTLIVLTSVALFSFGAGILPVNTYFAPIKASAQYQNPAYTQTETITADGYGVLPQNRPFGQAKLMARRAAVVEAQRNLLETVKDVAIDSETNVEMSMTLNDTIHSEISGVIRGARVIDEEYIPEDGIYRVTMSVPMYGVGSLGQVVFDNVIGNNQKVPVPAPSPAYNQSTQLNGNYTGLVIRARGAGLVRTFCPAIYDTSGRAIYGVYNVDKKYAIDYGVVGYAQGPQGWDKVRMGTSRAGSNPLVVDIVEVRQRVANKCDVVISVEDADRILAENRHSHFLDNYAVMFEI
ncbi:LPP20 family lipoprotein [Megamonas funiformis]|nr:LPP20 family lipoprotein [Megamonas funiformis]